MIRAMLVVVLVMAFTSSCWAQEPRSADTTGQSPATAENVSHDAQAIEKQYLIEIKILESREVLPEEERSADKESVGAQDHWPTAPAAASEVPSPKTDSANDLEPTAPVATKSTRAPESVQFRPRPGIWDAGYNESQGVTVIAAPRLIVLANRSASIEMTTEQSFTYLQPDGQGRYERKQSELHDLGVWISLAVEPVAGDDQAVKVPSLEIQVAALDGREPVAGLEDLAVGEPIIGKRSLKTTAKLQSGETRFISIPTGPERHASLAIRITQLDVGAVDPQAPK